MIIWLASYPKSGNTYLRALLASYFFTEDGNFNFETLDSIKLFPHLTLFEKYDNEIIKPSRQEVDINNRSRSAKLRFAIRNKNDFFYPSKLVEKFKKYLELEATNV